jgi:hypothetical protein
MFTQFTARLRQSLALFLFTQIYRLLFSRRVCDYREYHDRCEDAYSGRIGPIQLYVNECFVLDHRDGSIGLYLPCPCREQTGGWRWQRVRLVYTVALGTEQIRPSGWSWYVPPYWPCSENDSSANPF